MTLVEVLAALAVLGGLLAALVLARARLVRQWSHGQERLEAVAVAESLLSAWWADPINLPHETEGTLTQTLQDLQESQSQMIEQERDTTRHSTDHPITTDQTHFRGGWRWRTQIVERPEWEGWDVQVVRLEVWPQRALRTPETDPWASVEVLMPKPEATDHAAALILEEAS